MAALLELLRPRGPLSQAMRGADMDGATRFLFPRERLPTHTQMLLSTSAGRAELLRWPQYASGLVTDGAGRLSIQMTVTQYFFAWFSFYVFRGGEADTRVYGGVGPDMLRSSGEHERLLPESMKKVVHGVPSHGVGGGNQTIMPSYRLAGSHRGISPSTPASPWTRIKWSRTRCIPVSLRLLPEGVFPTEWSGIDIAANRCAAAN